MTFDNSGFEQLGQNIFLYKNFIDSAKAEELLTLALDRSDWKNRDIYGASVTTNHIKELEFITSKLSKRFKNGVILDNYCYFQKYEKDQYMGAHRDDNKVLEDIEKSKLYIDQKKYKEVNQPIFGIALYLNKTDGGNLIYTKQNISYSPNPGDLIVHSATEECTHMSETIKSGVKVIIPLYAYKVIRVPID